MTICCPVTILNTLTIGTTMAGNENANQQSTQIESVKFDLNNQTGLKAKIEEGLETLGIPFTTQIVGNILEVFLETLMDLAHFMRTVRNGWMRPYHDSMVTD